MKVNILFFLLSLILFSPVVFSLSCSTSTFNDILGGDSGRILGVALFLTVLIIALAYAFGSIMNNQHATVFAKEELFPLFMSAILVVGIGSVVFFSCSLFSSFLDYSFSPLAIGVGSGTSLDSCYVGSDSLQRLSFCYLSRTKAAAQQYVSAAMDKSLHSEMDSTNVIGASNPISGSVSLPTTAWKRAYAAQFESMAMSFALPSLISLTIQVLFLSLNVELIKWLLPAALLLRILPPTRHLGNVLIAIVIVLYVIVPFFYALNGAMDNKLTTSASCIDSYTSIVSDPTLDYDTTGSSCDSPTGYWALARLIPHAFFLPNLVLAISITFIVSLSKALEVIQ
ncbi:hypothetical protein HY990_00835 [Candidatus Micrarchaeota archaeon]|nr:hypothetical protein [Candidatus Micrarchaeota archaeon]